MTNYVWFETLSEPDWKQSSFQSKKRLQYMKTRASEAILKWNLAKFTCEQRLVESDNEHNPHTRFLMAVWLEIKPRYGNNYAVLLAPVMWLRETLVVRESDRNPEARNVNCNFCDLRLAYRKIATSPSRGRPLTANKYWKPHITSSRYCFWTSLRLGRSSKQDD